METFGYLERGTLIQVGTILKMNDVLKEVVAFYGRAPVKSYGRDVYYFTIDTSVLADNGAIQSYDKQDLEEMVAKGELKIYNES